MISSSRDRSILTVPCTQVQLCYTEQGSFEIRQGSFMVSFRTGRFILQSLCVDIRLFFKLERALSRLERALLRSLLRSLCIQTGILYGLFAHAYDPFDIEQSSFDLKQGSFMVSCRADRHLNRLSARIHGSFDIEWCFFNVEQGSFRVFACRQVLQMVSLRVYIRLFSHRAGLFDSLFADRQVFFMVSLCVYTRLFGHRIGLF